MIRRRLVVSVTIVMTIALLLAGTSILVTLEGRLIGPIDRDVRDRVLLIQDAGRRSGVRGILREAFQPSRSVYDEDRRSAVLVIDADGDVSVAQYAGRTADAAPIPDVSRIVAAPPVTTITSLTVSSEGGPRYRLAVAPITLRGDMVVVGESLAQVDETVREARRLMLLVGLIALAAVAAIVWFDTRRRLRPLEDMVDTAGRIAAGDLSARTAVDEDRSEVGALSTALDRMLDQIEDAVAVKTRSEDRMRRFVADASHELRTPLTSVRGYAELYRSGADDPESVARGMLRIEHEAARMTTLVEDLLLLARLDQRRPLALAPHDVGSIAAEAVDAARVVDPERPIEFDQPDLDVAARVDRPRVRQIIDNLLANVRSHTPPLTPVIVRVTRSGEAVEVSVRDAGPGMSAEVVDHVFEPFWQAGGDTSDGSGAGLGLSIVESIALAHGGSVDLTSDPGQGTTVTIRLPVDGPPLPPTAVTGADATSPPPETPTTGDEQSR